MTDMPRVICFYHDLCHDGLCAAAVVEDAYLREHGVVVESHGVDFNMTRLPVDVTGALVYFVDVTPRDTSIMDQAIRDAQRVSVIDHHATALDLYKGYLADGLIDGRISKEFSGARLAWSLMHPGVARPRLIDLVEDFDLWCFEDPLTEPVMLALQAAPKTVETYAAFLGILAHEAAVLEDLAEQGRVIKHRIDSDIDWAIDAGGVSWIDFDGYTVPAINLPRSHADFAGARLAEDAPFAVIYVFDGKGTCRVSLRSLQGRAASADVEAVARRFGGGGHATAAGARLDMDQAVALLRGDPVRPRAQVVEH